MEVRKGYRQTEVGIIPEDWEIRNVADMATTVASGKSHVNSEFGDYFVYGSTGIIGKSTHAEYSGKSILIARVGANAGKINIVDGEYGVTDNTIIVKIDDSCHWGYFWRQLEAKRLNSMVFGSGQPLITGTQIKGLGIPCPPTLVEQEAIAEALSDADTLIESLETLLAKKRQVKQGAMSELLSGKRRVVESAGVEIVQTELGRFPADWILTPLGALVDPNRSIRYGIVQPGDYDRQGRFMIRGQDYSKGWVDPSEVFRVSDVVEAKYKNARVKTGDLIMTIVGTCGLIETIPDWLDGANLTQTTARVAILPSKANSTFCKYMLQTEVGSLQVNNYMKGAVQPGLNCADVEKFLIPLPTDRAEQTAIAEILSDMDAEIRALEGKLSKARAVKAGMMSELLTGRVRLV